MTDTSDSVESAATRRTVLRGALVAGVGVPFLAACGGDDPASSGTEPSGGASSSGGESSSPGGGGGPIASTDDIPEGGGLILDDPQVVITQPVSGEFKAFSSICTHQGCPLDNVTDGTINCTCHGSQFSIEDGSVVGGPAPSPLPEEAITVKGSDISVSS